MYKARILICICFLLIYGNLKAQNYSVSGNSRYILKNSKPFVWVGDTAWELFHRLDREEAKYYLSKRAAQGFTVIQAVVLAEEDGLRVPNPYGEVPFFDQNPEKPNEKYFQHVDFILNTAAELGLTIALLPTWGDKLFLDNWGKGPVIFNKISAYNYGIWLGNRYKNQSNVIWILGGDRNPRKDSEDANVWRTMAKGISEAIGGNDKVLMSLHPQPNSGGSSEWFHTDDWFDFNMFQTGHCRYLPVYENIEFSYEKLPTKPTIDAEPIYEDHPVCFNANENGISSAYDVRKAIYLSVFAGSFGFTYGCHDIWQFYSAKFQGVNGPKTLWQQALDLPAANQVKHLKQLIESRPVLDRIPDQNLIVENNLQAHERIQATRGTNYAWIYSAMGKSFTVKMGKISGAELNAYWFNPRNGNSIKLGTYKNEGTQNFSPPQTGYGNDWVLLLDDSAARF